MDEGRFCIEVGGVYHVSTLQTLRKSPTLKTLLTKFAGGEEETPFVDRDGAAFYYVLNFLRNGSVQYIEDPSYIEFLIIEAGYYGLRKMEGQLSKMLTERRSDASSDVAAELRCLRQLLRSYAEDKPPTTRSSLSRPSSTNHLA